MSEPSPDKQVRAAGVVEQTIAGLIVLAVGSAAAWIYGQMSEAKISGWVFVAGIAGVALFATLIYGPWRRGFWGNIAKWRPFTTAATLDRVRAEARADAEAGRAKHIPSVRAQWFIHRLPDEKHTWTLMNTAAGSTARHVSLSVSNEYLQVGSALDWEEIPAGKSAKFMGGLTQKSHDFGIDFGVSWTNEHGQRLTTTVPWHSPDSY